MSNLIEYDNASAEVRAIYDDIRATRQTDYINNFKESDRPSSAHITPHLGDHQRRDIMSGKTLTIKLRF